jgi:hypothetical protein
VLIGRPVLPADQSMAQMLRHMGSDSLDSGWVGNRKHYSGAVCCCQNEWLLVKYIFRGQRFGISEGSNIWIIG